MVACEHDRIDDLLSGYFSTSIIRSFYQGIFIAISFSNNNRLLPTTGIELLHSLILILIVCS